jgi:hypothetical protein
MSRNGDIVEIKKASVTWVDGLEYSFLDREKRLIAKANVGKGGHFPRRRDDIANAGLQRLSWFNIDSDASEAIGWRDNRGGKLSVVSDRSNNTLRPEWVPFRCSWNLCNRDTKLSA